MSDLGLAVIKFFPDHERNLLDLILSGTMPFLAFSMCCTKSNDTVLTTSNNLGVTGTYRCFVIL
jgi:hypothetical protein